MDCADGASTPTLSGGLPFAARYVAARADQNGLRGGLVTKASPPYTAPGCACGKRRRRTSKLPGSDRPRPAATDTCVFRNVSP